MLKRCYCERFQEKNKSYKGCSVEDSWLHYSNFKAWYDNNFVEGYDMDKDLLKPRNKVYCEEYCIFIPRYLNTFLVDREGGTYLRGVSKINRNLKKPYVSITSFSGKRQHLGYFDNEIDAHFCWVKSKVDSFKDILDKYREEATKIDTRIVSPLVKRCKYLEYCLENKMVVRSVNNYIGEK